MVGDELDHRGDVLRRSSSAWAKYANAFRRISFARFSSRTSRSSSFNRSRSLVVRPGRCPASRGACRTHFRSVSAVQPSFGATDCSTAHAEAWASRCSSTIRTARSRTSGENRLGRPIDPILPSNEVSEKPGTIHTPPCRGRPQNDARRLGADRPVGSQMFRVSLVDRNVYVCWLCYCKSCIMNKLHNIYGAPCRSRTCDPRLRRPFVGSVIPSGYIYRVIPRPLPPKTGASSTTFATPSPRDDNRWGRGVAYGPQRRQPSTRVPWDPCRGRPRGGILPTS